MILKQGHKYEPMPHDGKTIWRIYRGGRCYYKYSPYSLAATQALRAAFPQYWTAISDYGWANPALVPSVNENPLGWGDLIGNYTIVEYIQANGSQRLEYPVSSQATRLEYLIQFTNLSSRQLMGQNGNRGYWGVNAKGNYERYTDSGIKAGGKDLIVLDNSQEFLTVNGEDTILPARVGWSGTDACQIFQLQGSFGCKAKLYKFDTYKDGEHICDAYPVTRKADGEIGMFDIKNRTFYTNAGTGKFTAG